MAARFIKCPHFAGLPALYHNDACFAIRKDGKKWNEIRKNLRKSALIFIIIIAMMMGAWYSEIIKRREA
jgi:hypothetical protein